MGRYTLLIQSRQVKQRMFIDLGTDFPVFLPEPHASSYPRLSLSGMEPMASTANTPTGTVPCKVTAVSQRGCSTAEMDGAISYCQLCRLAGTQVSYIPAL